MVFSSITFLCFFLPVVLVLYYLIPAKHLRNALLIAASLAFYAYGESTRVLLMIGCSLWNWLMGLLIMNTKAPRYRRLWFIVAFLIDLLFLGFYKYAGMLVSTLNTIAGTQLSDPGIALPIGISFFTFQAMSYVADVYRGKAQGTKNFFKVLLYISFFPQLIAGPIVRYRDIADEIDKREVTPAAAARGLRRFSFGLAKKVLIANSLAVMTDAIYALEPSALSIPIAWLGALSYMLQIYYDFSGYSDMAIGLGHMFGFHFLENFEHPYAASSMLDFWRRWHISLTNWFRENLYIPLGGNRKGKTRTWINRFVVFFFTGLWHGANWTFVLWGLFHGLLTCLEVAFPKMTKKMGFFSHVYVLFCVMIGFVLFRSESIYQAGVMIAHLFIPTGTAGAFMTATQLSALGRTAGTLSIAALVAGLVFMVPTREKLLSLCGPNVKLGDTTLQAVISYTVSIVLLALCILVLAGGAYNPFIYFRF